MRGVAPVTIRTEDRRLRNGPNLLPDLESPSGTRSRSAMVLSSTTQDSMGKEWMMTIYQRVWRAAYSAALRARLGLMSHHVLSYPRSQTAYWRDTMLNVLRIEEGDTDANQERRVRDLCGRYRHVNG